MRRVSRTERSPGSATLRTAAVVVALLVAGLPQGAAGKTMDELCRPLPVARFHGGSPRGLEVSVDVRPSDENLDSPFTVTVTNVSVQFLDRIRVRWAREDHIDPGYAFPGNLDEAQVRDLPPARVQKIELAPQKRGSVYYFQAQAFQGDREMGRSRLEICLPLIPVRREHARLPGIADRLARSRAFREELFGTFGFTPAAAQYIRSTSAIDVQDVTTSAGGGGWAPWDRLVLLNGCQREAAVHECAHVLWHDYRKLHPSVARDLARDVVRLSDLDPKRLPQFKAAIEFARGYVRGVGTWKGMYANDRGRVADVRRLTEADFAQRVNDWEIFAGFCSWTMGRFKDGSHRLPQFMWRYFELLFTGTIKDRPYYDGGPP